MRARGLKLLYYLFVYCIRMSRPMRARGLKLTSAEEGEVGAVAPHAGAWVETLSVVESAIICKVAPHAGAWVETLSAPGGP